MKREKLTKESHNMSGTCTHGRSNNWILSFETQRKGCYCFSPLSLQKAHIIVRNDVLYCSAVKNKNRDIYRYRAQSIDEEATHEIEGKETTSDLQTVVTLK